MMICSQMASLSSCSLWGLNLLKCLLIEWDFKGEKSRVKYATHHLELEATGHSVSMLLKECWLSSKAFLCCFIDSISPVLVILNIRRKSIEKA